MANNDLVQVMGDLGDEAHKTGLARMRFLIELVTSEPEREAIGLSELCLDLPANSGTNLKQLRALCNQRVEVQWLAALIFTVEPSEPDRLAGYQKLAGAVLFAMLALEHKSSEFLPQAERACREVRLLAYPAPAIALARFGAAKNVRQVYDRIRKLEGNASGKIRERFATLRVLLERHLEGKAPIRRQRDGPSAASRGSRQEEPLQCALQEPSAAEAPSKVFAGPNPAMPTRVLHDGNATELSASFGDGAAQNYNRYSLRSTLLGDFSDELAMAPVVRDQAHFEAPYHPVDNPEWPTVRSEVDFRGQGGSRESGLAISALRRRTWLYSGLARQLGLRCKLGVLTELNIARIRLIALDAQSDLTKRDNQDRFVVLLCALMGTAPHELVPALRRLWASRQQQSMSQDAASSDLLLMDNGSSITFQRSTRELRSIDGKGADLVAPPPGNLTLCLPASFHFSILQLAEALSQRDMFGRDINLALEAMSIGGLRKLRTADVQNLLRDSLRRTGADEAVCGHILGDRADGITAMHYASLEASQLQQAYNVAISHILGGGDIHTQSQHPEARVGSPLWVEPRKVQELYQAMCNELDQARSDLTPEGIVEFHNVYISFVTASLCLMTGYRPVRNPFERITDFDPRRRLLHICDKHLKTTSGDRYIPVPGMFIAQLQALKQHLEGMIVRPPFGRPEIAAACNAALNGAGPLLFTISADGEGASMSPMRPASQKKIFGSDEIWPLPYNWGRHVMRTQLVELVRDLSNAFMGHANPGAEPFAHHSAMAMTDLEDLRQRLEEICAAMGVIALEGLR